VSCGTDVLFLWSSATNLIRISDMPDFDSCTFNTAADTTIVGTSYNGNYTLNTASYCNQELLLSSSVVDAKEGGQCSANGLKTIIFVGPPPTPAPTMRPTKSSDGHVAAAATAWGIKLAVAMLLLVAMW
jgi:hypothetical protein